MRGVYCVAAAIFSAAFVTTDGAAEPTLSERAILSLGLADNRANAPTFLYYTGADLWRQGGTMYGGMLWSPGGLNNDGFTLKLLLAGGDYLYRSNNLDYRGAYALASLLPGYRFKRGDLEVKAFVGLDAQHHWVMPADPGNKLVGDHLGARFNVDIWWEPLPAQMMLAATLTASTIGTNYGVRGAAGWRIMNSF